MAILPLVAIVAMGPAGQQITTANTTSPIALVQPQSGPGLSGPVQIGQLPAVPLPDPSPRSVILGVRCDAGGELDGRLISTRGSVMLIDASAGSPPRR